MIARGRAWLGLIIVAGLLAGNTAGQTPPAGADSTASASAPAVAISPTVRTADNATPFQTQVDQYVRAQVSSIIQDDPATTAAVRKDMVDQCGPGSTPSFLEIYAKSVNAAVLAELSKNPPFRVRLNLAYLVESVSHAARTMSLEPVVLKLIGDPNDFVALWGIRAAKPIVDLVVQNPATVASDPLIPAIIAAVKQHASFGPIAEAAYLALNLDDINATKASIDVVFQPMMDILRFRISLYQSGVPDSPQADEVAARFLSGKHDSATEPVLQDIIQSLVDLISVASQQAQNASKVQVEQLIAMLKIAGQGLQVIVQESGTPPLVNLIGTTASSPGPAVAATGKQVFGELQSQAAYSYLKAPPPVNPTTGPTTGAAGTMPTH